MNQLLNKWTIEDIEFNLKLLKKAKKLNIGNELLNKWYNSGHIKLYSINNVVSIQIDRLIIEDGEVVDDTIQMDKGTKDRITNFLRKNAFLYLERWDAYIYNFLKD